MTRSNQLFHYYHYSSVILGSYILNFHHQYQCQDNVVEADYVIIGYGTAGQNAHKIIRRHDNQHKTIIIDPFKYENKRLDSTTRFSNEMIVSLDTNKKLISLTDNSMIKYKQCILTTGLLANEINAKKYIDSNCDSRDILNVIDFDTRENLKSLVKENRNLHITYATSNDWKSIFHAIEIADISKRQYGTSNTVSIITHSSGLLMQSLPRYLSQSFTRRVKKIGIDVIPFTQIRYVVKNKNSDDLSIFTECAYDSLYTSKFSTNKLVFPSTFGIPYFTTEKSTRYDYIRYWSDLIRNNNGLEIDREGRNIKVNSSMQAMNGVYVAGDLANVYNSVNGRGNVTGYDFAIKTSNVAATNMIRDNRQVSSLSHTNIIYDDIHIFEAKIRNLNTNMIFFGNCTTAYESHGFLFKWKDKIEKPTTEIIADNKSNNIFEKFVSSMQQPLNRTASEDAIAIDINTGENIVKQVEPVSFGVVFYIDESNIIRGILLTTHYNELEINKVYDAIKRLIGIPISKLIYGTESLDEDTMSPRLQKFKLLSSKAEKVISMFLLECAKANDRYLETKRNMLPVTQFKLVAPLQSSTKYVNDLNFGNPISPHHFCDPVFTRQNSNISKADILSKGYTRGIKHGPS